MDAKIHAPSSAAENLTKSNDILCATDRVVYQKELSAVNHRLADIRREISEASEKIRILQEEETRLTSYFQTYKKILHPIRDLPDEILREVFLACIESFDVGTPMRENEKSPTLDTTQPPWSLGQICRRWRQVTLTSPSLWTRVRIWIAELRCLSQKISGMASLLSIYLRRSGSLPLTIQITAPRPNSNHPFFLALYAHCFRWEAVHLRFFLEDNWDMLSSMSSMIKADIPALRSVYLTLSGRLPQGIVWDAFEFAPKLRSVVIRCSIRATGAAISLKLPWNQLETFYRGFLAHNRVTCEPLPHMSLSSLTYYGDHLHCCTPGTEIHLPRLKKLVLMEPLAEAEAFHTNFLDCIRPGREFSCLELAPRLELQWQPLESLLACSGGTMTRLRFTDNGSRNRGGADTLIPLSRLLDYTPTLSDLVVESPTQELMQCLAEQIPMGSGSPRFLPQLQTLTMTSIPSTFNDETWTKMLSTRASKLWKLTIPDGSLSEEMRVGMGQFEEQGLQVKFWPANATDWLGLSRDSFD